MVKKTIGVLAFQGDVVEHRTILEKLGVRCLAVRTLKDLAQADALIIPGGESTTIGFFLQQSGLGEEIKKRASSQGPMPSGSPKSTMRAYDSSSQGQMPVWGTCAGAIVMAKKIKSEIVPPHLGLMDMTIERNAYGRQIDSFYAKLQIPSLKIFDLEAAFIRAPVILEVGVVGMPAPNILASHDGQIVLVQQGHLLASTFHPELTGDVRLHEWFCSFIY